VTELKSTLQSILGDNNVSSAMAVREQHGRDESYHKCHPADLVVFPTNREEVSQVAKLCYENDVPMVPYGTGTGLEGGIVALKVNLVGTDDICFLAWVQCRGLTVLLLSYHASSGAKSLKKYPNVESFLD
jgi:FAD/FMN-containing dehydrogenase